MRIVAVVSGGMDSVTLAYHLAAEGHEVSIITFDYGQRHSKEIDFARLCADALEVSHRCIDLHPLGEVLTGSSLTTSTIPVPDGHYAEETMKDTVVPNRNAIMISIAAGVAVSEKADAVAVGVHGGDHHIYPDCRPDFLASMQQTLLLANKGFIADNFTLLAPFVDVDKAAIARRGSELGVNWNETWSCYKGQSVHCGTCGTCVERQEAFAHAHIADPTVYASPPSQKNFTSQ